MDRVAIFMDAGYLFAGGSGVLFGAPKKRTELALDVPKIIEFLKDKSAQLVPGVSLLRIYWYDGALPAGMTTMQQTLSSSNDVKVRLGIVNTHGQQKGVDAKIVTDLIELARNNAICDAILVGGDEDLRIGAEISQNYGVRVHLLTIAGSGVSPLLRYEADTHSDITVADIEKFLSLKPAVIPDPGSGVTLASTAGVPASASPATVDYVKVVTDYLSTVVDVDQDALRQAIETGTQIPREHDGRLIASARGSVCRQLESFEMTQLRNELKKQLGI